MCEKMTQWDLSIYRTAVAVKNEKPLRSFFIKMSMPYGPSYIFFKHNIHKFLSIIYEISIKHIAPMEVSGNEMQLCKKGTQIRSSSLRARTSSLRSCMYTIVLHISSTRILSSVSSSSMSNGCGWMGASLLLVHYDVNKIYTIWMGCTRELSELSHTCGTFAFLPFPLLSHISDSNRF